ncbi:YjjG family noncanonical pyrimidine nucleotidase [Mesotoga prima]|nr:YjjG family noncanonical pyrimidine nucleotidase [Mesotoga prima]
MSSKYKMYFFDLDHTILDFERSEVESLLELFKARDIDLSEEQVRSYQSINSKWWGYLEKGTRNKEEVVVGRFREYCDSIDVSFDPEELNDEYLTRLSRKAYFLPGAREFLTTLRRQGKRMAIITNGVYRVQHNRFLSAGLPEFFEFSLSSEEAGVAKPDPGIFHEAIRRAGVQRNEVVYIGDSLESDYRGAENAGIDFIWFGKHVRRNKGPVNIARNYDELLMLLV